MKYSIRARGGTLAAALAVATLACGSDDKPADPPKTDAVDEYVQALFVWEKACEGLSYSREGDPVWRGRLREAYGKLFGTPGAAITDARLRSCAERLRRPDCSHDDIRDFPECNFDEVAGTLSEGSACARNFQCKSTHCKRSGTSNCGVCEARTPDGGDCGSSATQPPCELTSQCIETPGTGKHTCQPTPPRKGAGEACGGSSGECKSELRCNRDSKTCGPPAALGSDCTFDSDCEQPQLRCDTDATRKCVRRGAEGEACNAAQSESCLEQFACDRNAGSKCVKRSRVKPGEACDGLIVLCETGACNVEAKTCPQVIPDGAACDANNRTQTCDVAAQCQSGTCAIADIGKCP